MELAKIFTLLHGHGRVCRKSASKGMNSRVGFGD